MPKKPFLSPESIIHKRTYAIYRHQKERAEKLLKTVTYSLDELRDLVRYSVLTVGACPYCSGQITAENFNADHRLPVARGGSFHINNVTIVCEGCNRGKGDLDEIEWRQICTVIQTWQMEVRKKFLTRLKLGGAAYHTPYKRKAGR